MVCHLAVEVDEHPRGGVVNDSGFDRLTGERANGLERFPPRDDGDLDGRVALALEERHASIAVDRGQLGDDGRPKVGRVLGRALGRRARLPDARDHGAAAPTTTVQGRTRQRLTRPFVTYGSALAKRSTTSALSARNTSSAPSGGSPSAPASINSPRACASRTSARCAGRNGVRLSMKPSTTSYIRAKCVIATISPASADAQIAD